MLYSLTRREWTWKTPGDPVRAVGEDALQLSAEVSSQAHEPVNRGGAEEQRQPGEVGEAHAVMVSPGANALDGLLGRLELVAQFPLRGGLVLEPDCETLDLLGQVGNPRVGRIKRLFLFFQGLHMLGVAPDRLLRRAQVLAWIRHRPLALLSRWPLIVH